MLLKKQGWNVYKHIFSDHWDGFKRRYSKYDDQYYDELVEKMLSCGDPDQIGYVEYMCFGCGECRRVVSMSCKCTVCLRCGNVKADDWVEKVETEEVDVYTFITYQPDPSERRSRSCSIVLVGLSELTGRRVNQ